MNRMNRMNRTTLGALALVASMASMTACASNTSANAASPSQATPPSITASGTYVAAAQADPSTKAFAYDQKLVPPGARSEVTLTTQGDKTTVHLTVSGFVPNRTYGAHLHANACGTDPKAAGSHFQHHADPAATQSPSVDPAYANPANEVWLDFTTDASGNATMTAEEPWALTADHQPHSLVVHADKTHTEAGKAGTAGARVSCLTLAA